MSGLFITSVAALVTNKLNLLKDTQSPGETLASLWYPAIITAIVVFFLSLSRAAYRLHKEKEDRVSQLEHIAAWNEVAAHFEGLGGTGSAVYQKHETLPEGEWDIRDHPRESQEKLVTYCQNAGRLLLTHPVESKLLSSTVLSHSETPGRAWLEFLKSSMDDRAEPVVTIRMLVHKSAEACRKLADSWE